MLAGLLAQGLGPLVHERWAHGASKAEADHHADAGHCPGSADDSEESDPRDEHKACRVCDMLLAAGRLVGGVDCGVWAAPDAGPARDVRPDAPWRAELASVVAARQRGPPAAWCA